MLGIPLTRYLFSLPVQDARDKVQKEYATFIQAARVADATAELDVLRTEATALLDRHLSKSADQIRKEQEATLAALQKRIDGAKGADWAVQFQKDLQNLAWFDSQVAANPAAGPKVAA